MRIYSDYTKKEMVKYLISKAKREKQPFDIEMTTETSLRFIQQFEQRFECLFEGVSIIKGLHYDDNRINLFTGMGMYNLLITTK